MRVDAAGTGAGALAPRPGDLDAQRQFNVVMVIRLPDDSMTFSPDLDEVVPPKDR